jgi:hypothetical protein
MDRRRVEELAEFLAGEYHVVILGLENDILGEA